MTPRAPVLSALLLLAAAAGGPAQDTPAPARADLLVRFRPGVSEARKRFLTAAAGTEIARVARTPRRDLYALRLRGAAGRDAVLRRLAADPDVAAVQPNHVYRTCETLPDDPRFGELWGLRNTGQTGGTPGADIAAAAAWDLVTGAPDVVVGVLDTGVRLSHQDLTDNRWINAAEAAGTAGVDDDGNGKVDDLNGWDFVDNDNDPFDGDGHGTHLAGTIGARGNNTKGVTGVCWEIRLLALRFIGPGGGDDLDAIQALDYAVDLKLNRGVNLVAINCSWTNDAFSPALYDAMKDAQDAGILLVCAAGNGGSNNDLRPVYPAGFDLPGILSVGASDHDDRPADLSGFGPVSVDLFAPGVGIRSTYVPQDNVYTTRTGTSMAAAHVSGAVGLLAALRPGEAADRRRARILRNVDRKGAFAGRSSTCGRLNVFRALQDDESVPPDPVSTLSASDPSHAGVTLSWTAPGDDGALGRAAAYDVRFSTSPISAATFDSAVPVPCPPLPSDAGAAESMRVSGLAAGTPHYFALRAIDNLGNASGVSNAALVTTLAASTALAFHSDDFESGSAIDPARWTAAPPWGALDLDGSRRAADSPGGTYGANLDLSLTSAVFNLTGKRDATLGFTQRYALEAGADFGFVEVSRDAGATWEWVTQASGTQNAFSPLARIPLPSLDGAATARLRFRLRTNGSVQLDGWAIDDVVVRADSRGSNGHPAAQPQSLSTLANTPVAILLRGSDPEGQPLTFTIATPPADGGLSGTPPDVVYEPAPGFTGTDRFTFTVTDGTDTSAPAEVAISVLAPGSPPTATPASLSVAVNASLPITLAGSDPDGDPLGFAIVLPPSNGTLSGAPPDVTYTPAPDYAGPDQFTFTVSDGWSTSAPAAVSIQVGAASGGGGGGSCGLTGLEALLLLGVGAILRRAGRR